MEPALSSLLPLCGPQLVLVSGSLLLGKRSTVTCLWSPFGGFLHSAGAALPPISLCPSPSSSLWFSWPAAHAQPAASLLRDAPEFGPCRCENDILSLFPAETDFEPPSLGSLFSSHVWFLFCLFLPHYLPSAYMGDPVSFALRKTVVLRAFLGHVPECSGKWDRASCGLLGRGSATTLGLSPFPFLLCPFIESPTLTFLAVVTPPAFSLSGAPVEQAPLPASLDRVWASSLCGES